MNRLREILITVSKFAVLIWIVYIVAAVGMGEYLLGWPEWVGDVFFVLGLICMVLELLALAGIAVQKQWSLFCLMFILYGITIACSILILGIMAVTSTR